MSFSTVIARADHRWDFDGDLVDSINALNGVNTSIDFPTTPVCQGVSASARTNATGDNISVADANDINLVALSQFYIGGWIQLSGKQGPPTCIWKTGGLTANRGIFTGVNNNNLVFQHSEGTGATVVQNYSDIALANIRNYYVGMRFDNGICDAFIDGVKQSISDPSDSDTGNTTFPIHNSIDWGNIDSTVNLGGSTILIKALVNCLYNEWSTFSGADIPTDLEIRQDLFEEKAIATNIITSGTEASMQLQMDAYASTVGLNKECDFEIQAVTGDGNITVTLDNRTFSSLCSLHIRYLGTGTLTVINTNGSNCSITSGNVVIENPSILTINDLVDGCEVRLYDDNVGGNNLGTELAGIESNIGTTFTYKHAGITNNIAIQVIATGYNEILLKRTLVAANQNIAVSLIIDNNA